MAVKKRTPEKIPVRTQHVSIVSRYGDRLKKPLWSKPRLWRKYPETGKNLKQAITYAINALNKQQLGTIVYVGENPVYHCKWGGGRGFQGWKDNPVAGYWRKIIVK